VSKAVALDISGQFRDIQAAPAGRIVPTGARLVTIAAVAVVARCHVVHQQRRRADSAVKAGRGEAQAIRIRGLQTCPQPDEDRRSEARRVWRPAMEAGL
jgi:hypothetical protein